MRCIRVTGAKEPLLFLDKEPVPSAPEGGAVVKVSYSGVCHSDVDFWEGRRSYEYPRIPGHEISGVVVSFGKSLTENETKTDVKVGDRVVVFPMLCCDSCRPCKSGQSSYCVGSSPQFLAYTQNGGYAEYVAVSDLWSLVPLPESIPPSLACLLPCSGLTAYNAVEEGLEFVKTILGVRGCSVLIFGAGGLGQWALRLARALYPPETQIISADIKQEALDGVVSNVKDVTPLLLSRNQSSEQTAQQVKTASYAGDGVDLVLDFVGVKQTFEVAMKSLRTRGRYHVIGLFGGEVQFQLWNLALSGIAVKGIFLGSIDQLKRLLELVKNNPTLYANLQYEVHPLEDGIQVLEKLAKGKLVGRAVLKCDEGEQ